MMAVIIMAAAVTAEEIREIRGLYGLTQRSFAKLLGIGEASLARYESGSVPSKANANLIRAARHPEFMMECLERDGELIPTRQREQAMRRVYACISLEPGEAAAIRQAEIAEKAKEAATAPTMDDVYHFTIQQEVLNEQAANLIGEMISMKLSSSYVGEASDVFDDLLDQVAEIKPTIVSADTMNDKRLAVIRGFLNCASGLLERQKLEVA